MRSKCAFTLNRLAAAALAACALAACGAAPSERPFALLVSDATSSFIDFGDDCVSDFQTVARVIAEREGDLYAGPLVTGDPYRQRWTVERHFGEDPPPSIKGNADLELAHRRRQAEDLAGDF